MNYTIIAPFGPNKSKGTFDDIFDSAKYSSIETAWRHNDFVKCDYVKDVDGTIYIEMSHIQTPDTKKHYRLQRQSFPAGIDILDDQLAADMAATMLLPH